MKLGRRKGKRKKKRGGEGEEEVGLNSHDHNEETTSNCVSLDWLSKRMASKLSMVLTVAPRPVHHRAVDGAFLEDTGRWGEGELARERTLHLRPNSKSPHIGSPRSSGFDWGRQRKEVLSIMTEYRAHCFSSIVLGVMRLSYFEATFLSACLATLSISDFRTVSGRDAGIETISFVKSQLFSPNILNIEL